MCEILEHLVNTLTADDKHSLGNTENLPEPTQMQLYKKQKICSQFLNILKKITLIGYVCPQL